MNLHMTDVTCSGHGCLPSPLKRPQDHAILNANVSGQCMHVEMGGHFNEQSKGRCSDTSVVIRILDYECHVPTVRSGSVQFGQSDHFTVSLNEKGKIDITVRQHLIQISIGSLRNGTEEAVGEGFRGAASQHGFDRWTIAWRCPRKCNVGKSNGVGRYGNRGTGPALCGYMLSRKCRLCRGQAEDYPWIGSTSEWTGLENPLTGSRAGRFRMQPFLNAYVRAHNPTCPPAITGFRDAVSSFRSSPTAAIAPLVSSPHGITLNDVQPASM